MAPTELTIPIFLDIVIHGFIHGYLLLFGILFIFKGRKEENIFLKGMGIAFILLAISDFLTTYGRSFYLGLTPVELAADPGYVLLWRAFSIIDQLALFIIAYVVGNQTIEGDLIPEKIPLFWVLPAITVPNIVLHLFIDPASNWRLLALLTTLIILLLILIIYLRIARDTEGEFRRMALAFAGGIFCIGWARAFTGRTFMDIAAGLLTIDQMLYDFFAISLQLLASLLFVLAILLIAYSNLFKAD